MSKPDYFEGERLKELPFLETAVERYDMLFIDTSSIMFPHFPRFIANILPLLKKYDKHLIVCESVLRELKRLKTQSDETDSLAREVYSFMGLFVLDKLIAHGVLRYLDDGIEEGPADLAFQKMFVSLRPKKRLLLIAQDGNLTNTILRFNLDRSVYAEPIGVKHISDTGFLEPRSKPLQQREDSKVLTAQQPKEIYVPGRMSRSPNLRRAEQTLKESVPVADSPVATIPVATAEQLAPAENVQRRNPQNRRSAVQVQSERVQAIQTPVQAVPKVKQPVQRQAKPTAVVKTQEKPAASKQYSGAFTARDAKKFPGNELHVPEGYSTVGYIDRPDVTLAFMPDSVTSIGEQAFKDCASLMHVVISDSVTSIGASAFLNCHSLSSVQIPTEVTVIENGTFKYCSGLKDVRLHEKITSIGSMAFKGCTSLKTITLPASVTEIGRNAFSSCPNLVINCTKDSYAHAYVIMNRLKHTVI